MGGWLAITPKVKLYALIALAFVAGLFRWRAVAISNALGKAKAAQLENRLRAIQTAKEVENEVGELDDTDLAARAAKWVRGANK
jgi:hypothetical protein|tara:strand:+ start:353 stop:604 length:252 start_codon:yes stop_codon:yes gene_type:complete